jgi:hypothetical protein
MRHTKTNGKTWGKKNQPGAPPPSLPLGQNRSGKILEKFRVVFCMHLKILTNI